MQPGDQQGRENVAEHTLISSFLSTASHSFLTEGIRALTGRGELLVESELLGTFA